MEQEKKTFFDKMEEVLVPIAMKLANQPHLAAVRDSFVTTFPVVLSGTVLLLINAILQNLSIHVLPDAAWLTSIVNVFGQLAGPAVDATNGIMAIFVSFLIAYNYVKNQGENGAIGGILSIAGFFVFYAPGFAAEHPLMPGAEQGVLLRGNFGATGIFTAMLVGLLVSSAYVWLNQFEGLDIKMPEEVPPAVASSFSALLPSMIIMLVMVIINMLLLNYVNPMGLSEIIKNLISAPLMRLGDSPFTLLVIVFLQTLLWVFGIHGPNTLAAVTQTIYAEINAANTDFINANPTAIADVPHKFPSSIYDAFGNYGGGGATLGLLIAILLFSKREDYKTVAKLSVVPGIFNINEPVIFGLPIVLNPVMAIPFMITPVVCTGIALLAINFNLVPTPVYAGVWILPGPINAFLTTLDWRALILGILLIGVSVLIYTPFVLMSNDIAAEEQ